jgi:hypothetical protein
VSDVVRVDVGAGFAAGGGAGSRAEDEDEDDEDEDESVTRRVRMSFKTSARASEILLRGMRWRYAHTPPPNGSGTMAMLTASRWRSGSSGTTSGTLMGMSAMMSVAASG